MVTRKASARWDRGTTKRRPIYDGVAGAIAKAVDNTVSIFAPRLAHDWRIARIKSAALIAHEGARVTEQQPRAESGSADAEILPDLRQLRDRSRNLIRDDAHAAATINIHEECVVGEGIRPQAACTPETTGMTDEQCAEWNQACNAEWERWAEDEADATRVGTFYDLQALALRCYLQDGDSIGHAVVGGDGLITCELIDADRIESPNGIDTQSIRGGVEIGPHGERLAFHILPNHPDDRLLGAGSWTSQPTRVPVSDNGIVLVQHVFKRTRAGQTRGVPLLTASLLYSKNLHHYLDSELIAARAASNFALFIKRSANKTDQDFYPVRDDEQATGQQYHQELSPGIIEYLNEGEEPVPFNPNRPGNAFEPFVVRVLRAIAASSGLSYEVVCRDFARMNLSSARAMLREIKRGFDLTRRRLVRGFCRPWWENVLRMAIGAGRLKPPARFLDNARPFLACDWVAPAYGMVDPETDVKGSMLSVDANLSDQWSEAAKYGLDAEQLLRKRARFYRMALDVEAEFDLEPGTLTKERPQRTESSQPDQPNGAKPPGVAPDEDEADPEQEDPVGDDADQPEDARR